MVNTANQEREMRVAVERVVGFAQEFGETHLNLACHAAFPLSLTPDLLYQIWANFVPEAPWTAVARVLLSRLCKQVGSEMYEMDNSVRNLLLLELKVQFGQKIFDSLGEFLLEYVRQRLTEEDPDTKDLRQAQEWTALAYTKPQEAARELARFLSNKVQEEDIGEVLRLGSLVETLSKPLVEAGFEPLLVYGQGMKSYVCGDLETAKIKLGILDDLIKNNFEISGIKLNIPKLVLPANNSVNNLEKTGIKALLTQLQTQIEEETNIDALDKSDALEEVENLVKASQENDENLQQTKPGKPLRGLYRIIRQLPETTKLKTLFTKLYPKISSYFNLVPHFMSNINLDSGNYNEFIQGDSYQQSGNFGIGHMNAGEIKDLIVAGYINTVGDLTTSADKRAKDALAEIQDELQSNFQSLAITIQDVESNKPQTFWDIRRANETELAYQDRARANFVEYISGVEAQINLLKFSQDAYKSLRNSLAYDRQSAHAINIVYKQLDEVKYSLTSFRSSLNHILSLTNLSDQERTAESDSLHREKIANARMTLAHATAYFCLVLKEEIDIKILSDSLNLADIDLNLKPGQEGYKRAMQAAAGFSRKKGKIVQEKIKVVDEAKQREVARLVTDPYLALLRKTANLPPALSDAEIFALQNKEIDEEETDPLKLFQLAGFSFLESDGHASAIYFKRAIQSNQLSPLQEKFARLSIDRLENPDTYEDSLGIMVIKITSKGNFDRAGLKEGDIIISVNGETINEPGEIASELGKSGDNPILLGLIRDGKSMRKVIKGGESAGATLSPLIILNGIQL